MFKIGDKVRCINPGNNDVILNRIYTVLKVLNYPDKEMLIINNTRRNRVFSHRFELINKKGHKLTKIFK